ncbi:MAG: sulfite exporter TauE/SafE family protein [Marinobacter sp.]|nr:sulfite exporter TauE/SafE family protein [Marinobacter sp.]
MEYTATFWVLAVIGVFITGISKSGFAGGIGVVTVPLLALEIGPLKAAAIMLPVLLAMDYLSVRAWWGQQINGQLKLLLPASVCGIVTGWILYDFLNEQVLNLVLGITAIMFALWGLFKGVEIRGIPATVLGPVCGAIAGFTSFVAHAGGPPLNIYLVTQQLPRKQFLATAVMFFASINLIKVIPYLALGQINPDNLLVALILFPVAWIGVKAGLVLQQWLNDQIFYRVILIFLLAIGIRLVFGNL